MLSPKTQRNHMLPIRCIHEPCRNIEVRTCETCRPGSVRQTSPSPMGNWVPGGNARVSSPGISPRSHTDRASASGEPAPWKNSQVRTLRAISRKVTMGVRWVWFSSRYGNMSGSAYRVFVTVDVGGHPDLLAGRAPTPDARQHRAALRLDQQQDDVGVLGPYAIFDGADGCLHVGGRQGVGEIRGDRRDDLLGREMDREQAVRALDARVLSGDRADR